MHGAPIRKRLVALAALVALSAVSVASILSEARASDLKYFYSLRDNYTHKAKRIDVPPVEKLFNNSSLIDFDHFRKIKNCYRALTYIEFAVQDLIRNSQNSLSDAMMLQKLIVAREFQEHLYCGAMRTIDEADILVRKHGLKGWAFQDDFEASGGLEIAPSPLSRRNSAILELLLLAFEDHAPAQLTLVRLSEKGEAIRLTKGFAYYLLARAKMLGASDTDLDAMLEKAAAEFHPADRVRLDLIAAVGKWPRDKRLIMD